MTTRRLLLLVHWALPVLTILGVGLAAGRGPWVVLVGAVLCVVLRPVHLGAPVRAAVAALVLLAWVETAQAMYRWPFEVFANGWEFVGTVPTIVLRLPSYAVYLVLCLVVLTLASWLSYLLVYLPLFALFELESSGRQAARDRAAARIMADPEGARFSLYLRPFSTSGNLGSNAVGVAAPDGAVGNVQTDYEALLAAAFPAHRPLIALGTPGALLSTQPEGVTTWPVSRTWDIPGTGKIRSSGADWRRKVIALARNAENIVVVPLDFPGTTWEVRWLHHSGLLHKCLFVMPATMAGAGDYAEAWKRTVAVLGVLGLKAPAYRDSGGIHTVDENGTTMTRHPSFTGSPVPRATALLVLFRWLSRNRPAAVRRPGPIRGERLPKPVRPAHRVGFALVARRGRGARPRPAAPRLVAGHRSRRSTGLRARRTAVSPVRLRRGRRPALVHLAVPTTRRTSRQRS